MHHKNSVFYRWIASYLIIFSFPLIINLYLYNHHLSTLRSEVINSNRVLVENMQQNVDNIFSEADRLIAQICLNDTISTLLTREEIDADTLISMREIMAALDSYRSANHYIDSFYLYCKGTDTIISPEHILSRTDFLDLDLQLSSIDYRTVTNVLLNSGDSRTFLINTSVNSPNSEAFVITQGIPLISDSSNGVVMIILDKEKLLANFDSKTSSGFYITDRNSNILPIRPLSAINDMTQLTSTPDEQLLSENSEKIHVIKTRSSNTGWSYISVIEEALIVEKLNKTKIITFIILFIYLILGGFISFSLFRYNYKPFEKLISVIEQKSGNRYDSSTHEYAFIEDTVRKISGKQAELNRYIKQQDNILKMNFINRMLKEGTGTTTEEALARYEIDVVSDNVLIGLIHFSSLDNLFSGENLSDREIYEYAIVIVSNITSEFLEKIGKVFFTVIDNSVAFGVIAENDDCTDMPAQVKEAVNRSASFIAENFNFSFYTAVSNIHSFTNGIHIAYQEALTCMEYKNINSGEKILMYRDLKLTGTQSYYYSHNHESQLINLIKTGKAKEASLVIDQIFTDCQESGKFAPGLLKVLIYDIIGTVIRTVTEIFDEESPHLAKIIPMLDKLSACQDITELKAVIHRLLPSVCEHIPQNSTKSIGETVKAFIVDNFHDPMLSVSMIASNIDMHPNYLSTIFKEQMGFNILEYITTVRIDTAKRLLRENELTIDKIATTVGYTNSHTFTRTFKKFEKITPSDYRKAHKNKI